jgi:hypothetical protein
MFGRFNRFNTTGSMGNASESAFRCASFALILLVIDAVFAVSIFVCADILSLGLVVSVLLGLVVLAILIIRSLILESPQARPKQSAA